jgi:flagellar hook-associated protein 3 FlgL
MRIPRSTQSGMTALLQNHSARINGEVRKLEIQAITGLKVNKPSDGPTETAAALRLQGLVGDQEVFQRNSVQATSLLAVADDALGQVSNIFKRAREIAIQGGSEQFNANDRESLATEVSVLREQLTALSNTRLGDRYIFSGTDYNTEAFDASGTYGGSTDAPETRISQNQWADVGFDGSDVFQGDVDAFALLEDLEDALNNNDPETVRGQIGDLESGAQQAIDWREVVGHSYKTVDDAAATAESLSAVLQTELGELVNADPAETYTRLAELRQNYQAAMQVGASTASGTLFALMR